MTAVLDFCRRHNKDDIEHFKILPPPHWLLYNSCSVQPISQSVSEPTKTFIADALSLCGSWASCLINDKRGCFAAWRRWCPLSRYDGSLFTDMKFLAAHVWPRVQSVACHDSYSCQRFPASYAFPAKRQGAEHVGAVMINSGALNRVTCLELL